MSSISPVQTPQLRVDQDPELVSPHCDAYIAVIDTAEVVARDFSTNCAARN
jgi:acetyl-CoA C-acetyltransferase